MRQSKLDAEALRARWSLRQAAFKERQAAKAVAAEKRATSIAPSHVDVGASLLLAGLSDDLTDSHVRAFMLTKSVSCRDYSLTFASFCYCYTVVPYTV